MTAQKDLKRLVRGRMSKTGESYTSALRFIRASKSKERAMTTQTQENRTLQNRYLLKERLGSDLTGDLYRALDLRQQEAEAEDPYVAVKLLNCTLSSNKEALLPLQHQASNARSMHTENVIAVYDFDRDGDTLYMVTELLQGEPLDIHLKKNPQLPPVDATRVINGICEAFKVAHRLDIVHGDFKPGNVFYTRSKVAKVINFGIAHALPSSMMPDNDPGKLARVYASNEILKGNAPSKSDDIFAVALVAYLILTGEHPFGRVTADVALDRALVPDRIESLSSGQWDTLSKALALSTSDRLRSIEALSEGFN